MSCSDLTKQKMLIEYWYQSISCTTQMLNILPDNHFCQHTTPHKLVYGEKPNKWTWFPLLSIGYFHHQIYVSVTISYNQFQTLSKILMSRDTNSKTMTFYNPVTIIVYTTGYYDLDPVRHTNTHFRLIFKRAIFVGTYRSYSYHDPEPYPYGKRVL